MFDFCFLGQQIISISEEDHKAKLYLCSKYLETFTHVKEHENFVELSIDLLVGMRDLLSTDEEVFYRSHFVFLHVTNMSIEILFCILTYNVAPVLAVLSGFIL